MYAYTPDSESERQQRARNLDPRNTTPYGLLAKALETSKAQYPVTFDRIARCAPCDISRASSTPYASADLYPLEIVTREAPYGEEVLWIVPFVLAGASPNSRVGLGCSALARAASRSRADVVGFLLSRGADPNSPGSVGPLYISVYDNDRSMTRLLLAAGARLGMAEALNLAIINDNSGIIRDLYCYGAPMADASPATVAALPNLLASLEIT